MLRSTATEFLRLRDVADNFASQAALSKDEQSRLLIILDELFSNILRHGYDPTDVPGTVEVLLSFGNGNLCIELIDDGRPFNPLAAAPPNLQLPPAQRPTGGLGIHIVRSLVGEAHYARKNGRNCLTLSRKIDPPASADR